MKKAFEQETVVEFAYIVPKGMELVRLIVNFSYLFDRDDGGNRRRDTYDQTQIYYIDLDTLELKKSVLPSISGFTSRAEAEKSGAVHIEERGVRFIGLLERDYKNKKREEVLLPIILNDIKKNKARLLLGSSFTTRENVTLDEESIDMNDDGLKK